MSASTGTTTTTCSPSCWGAAGGERWGSTMMSESTGTAPVPARPTAVGTASVGTAPAADGSSTLDSVRAGAADLAEQAQERARQAGGVISDAADKAGDVISDAADRAVDVTREAVGQVARRLRN